VLEGIQPGWKKEYRRL